MIDTVRRIAALARLIIIDGIKRHALVGLLCFGLAGELSGMFFFDFIPRDIGRATNDFLFSISFMTGFIFLLFHAVQIAAWDDTNLRIHTFLARPISRTEYLLGLFTGLAFLLLLLNIILSGTNWILLSLIKSNLDPAYFQHLIGKNFILATAGLYLIELSVLAVIILFASVVRGNFPVLLLTLAYYAICNGLPVVRESVSQQLAAGNGKTLALLLQGMTGIFPDFSRLDFKSFVISGTSSFSAQDLFLIFSVHLFYIVITLWLGALVFKKRDLM